LRAFLDTIPSWHVERPNYVRLVLHPEGLRRFIVNWEEVARALLNRIHREADAVGPDEPTRELLAELLAYPDVPGRWGTLDVASPRSVVIPMPIVRDRLELRLFSTVTTVGAPRDITVQELRIECFIPSDDATERAVEALRNTPSPFQARGSG